jgi:carbamate kinase
MPIAVAALSGNAIVADGTPGTADIGHAPIALARLVALGWDLVITHAPAAPEAAYRLQQELGNVLREARIPRSVASVLTQVVIDPHDPDHAPHEIVEIRAIRLLVESGIVAIAGGAVPVVREGGGRLRGVETVIDKDRASSLLARLLGADLLILFTRAPEIVFDSGRPDERPLRRLTVGEARTLLSTATFVKGGMGPRLEAATAFTAATGRPAILASPERILDALVGTSGTVIRP